ncbi:hypothetical protein GIB67_034942 [Kingdonia uniflora]|uniref:Pentatricopeptide repeat-containing protein n=1 Tax=Kingdonia uniflora TaxID=39325 RepID=A0A7J7NGL9_9MAGN|nr:hypothetical protein GIB67_034942 [Kingdonia uniflora]
MQEKNKVGTVLVWNVLVKGCCKIEDLEEANELFEAMPKRNICCLNAGFWRKGELKRARMLEESGRRNDLTIVSALCAWLCMGALGKSFEDMQISGTNPDEVVFLAILTGPQNIKMAELASKRLLELEPEHSGSYVLLSNICAGVGRWSDAEKVIVTLKSRGVKKPPG